MILAAATFLTKERYLSANYWLISLNVTFLVNFLLVLANEGMLTLHLSGSELRLFLYGSLDKLA